MNAQEARDLSFATIKKTSSKPYIEAIDAKIQEAASNGKFLVSHPFNIDGLTYPDSAMLAHIINYYTEQKFTIKLNPNPDPGHPCSREFYTLSW